MVLFSCDASAIVRAKQKLESEDDSDPANYLCRIILFCQGCPDCDVSTATLAIEERVAQNSECTGLVVSYEHSVLIVLEMPPANIWSSLLEDFEDFFKYFEGTHICLSEEGVKREFSNFKSIRDSGEERVGAVPDLKDCDENAVVDALVDVIHELLTDCPQTSGADKLLSQIVRNGKLFTRKEFLDMYDITTHICRTVEKEPPQSEELVIESDICASLRVK